MKTPELFVTLSADGSQAVITLPKEYTLGGQKTDKLTMREPTVNDQLAAEEAGGKASAIEVALFANLCMLTPAELGGLGIKAYKRVQTAYQLFTD